MNRARRSPPDFQSTEVERQVADYNVAETGTTRECLRLLLHTSALVVWLVVAFALSFVCSCCSILIISVLQCLLASAWIVPQALLSIDIAVTLPSLCAGSVLLLSGVECTSSVEGNQSGNRARRIQPGSTHRGHRGGLLTPTLLQQGQQESASDCCCTQHLWLFGCLVGC